MVGSTKDPADGKAVAGSVFAAVVVYAVWLVSLTSSILDSDSSVPPSFLLPWGLRASH